MLFLFIVSALLWQPRMNEHFLSVDEKHLGAFLSFYAVIDKKMLIFALNIKSFMLIMFKM